MKGRISPQALRDAFRIVSPGLSPTTLTPFLA